MAVRLRVALLLSFVAACAPEPFEPYLRWETRAAATPVEGRVAIKAVVNMRPAKHGGDELNSVGNIRGGPSGSSPLRIDAASDTFKFEPQALDAALTGFVKDALAAAGIGTADAGDALVGARLIIEVHELWIELPASLYDPYVANVALVINVVDPATGQVRATLPVRGEGEATAVRHSDNDLVYARRAYRRALDQAYTNLVAGLAHPAVRAALVAPPPPPQTRAAPPPAAPATSGPCSPDMSITDQTAGHCCWPGQIWANDKCNGRPARCPQGKTARGDRCVEGS